VSIFLALAFAALLLGLWAFAMLRLRLGRWTIALALIVIAALLVMFFRPEDEETDGEAPASRGVTVDGRMQGRGLHAILTVASEAGLADRS
jgi:hypothetical protein